MDNKGILKLNGTSEPEKSINFSLDDRYKAAPPNNPALSIVRPHSMPVVPNLALKQVTRGHGGKYKNRFLEVITPRLVKSDQIKASSGSLTKRGLTMKTDPLQGIMNHWIFMNDPKSFTYKRFERSFQKAMAIISERECVYSQEDVSYRGSFFEFVYTLSKKLFSWGLLKESLDVLYLTAGGNDSWEEQAWGCGQESYQGVNASIASVLKEIAEVMLEGEGIIGPESPLWYSLVLKETISSQEDFDCATLKQALSEQKRVKQQDYVQYILDYQIVLLRDEMLTETEDNNSD